MVEMIVPMENLNDPMDINLTFKVTNIDDITIYVKSELVSPPAGWSGSAEEHGAIGAGVDDYFLNDNYTRTKPSTDTEETITLKISYYSDSGYSSLMGYETVSYTITYVDFTDASYTVVDDDTFETTTEGWNETNESGAAYLERTSDIKRSGIAAIRHYGFDPLVVAYLHKSFTISNVTRAYIRIWLYFYDNGATEMKSIFELITDAADVSNIRTLPIAVSRTPKGGTGVLNRWLCIGLKIPVNGTFQVKLRNRCENWVGSNRAIYYDDIKVVES